jgi:hypothetical protein
VTSVIANNRSGPCIGENLRERGDERTREIACDARWDLAPPHEVGEPEQAAHDGPEQRAGDSGIDPRLVRVVSEAEPTLLHVVAEPLPHAVELREAGVRDQESDDALVIGRYREEMAERAGERRAEIAGPCRDRLIDRFQVARVRSGKWL